MESNIIIRPIAAKDNSDLAKVIRQTLVEFGANHRGTVYYDETTDRLSTLFTVPGSAYFVAEQHGEILGGGGIFPTQGLASDTCELVKMYLMPATRGKGLGAALLQKCIVCAINFGYKKMYLETMPELHLAIKLYQKAGFEKLDSPLGQSGHFSCNTWMLLNLEQLPK